jgi:succinate dehydrogenase / fumarate reductase cytochrome b subunit
MQGHPRPRFLSLFRIHLPITGLLSISHRISGALFYLSLPLWLWLWQHSLRDAAGYAQVQEWLTAWPLRLLLALLSWWLLHHLLAGLRILLLDMDVGVGLPQAKASATALMWLSLLLLLALLGLCL